LAITEAASTGGLGELSPGATPGNNGGKSADKARE